MTISDTKDICCHAVPSARICEVLNSLAIAANSIKNKKQKNNTFKKLFVNEMQCFDGGGGNYQILNNNKYRYKYQILNNNKYRYTNIRYWLDIFSKSANKIFSVLKKID